MIRPLLRPVRQSFLKAYQCPPEEIILDIDANDDALHGHKFFHGLLGLLLLFAAVGVLQVAIGWPPSCGRRNCRQQSRRCWRTRQSFCTPT